MYKAKLSYAQINEYLTLLIEGGHLELKTVKRKRQVITLYDLTDRGHELLDALMDMYKLWNSDSYNNAPHR